MKRQQYNKHKKRSHRSYRNGLIGMQISKTARPLSRWDMIMLRGVYGRSS